MDPEWPATRLHLQSIRQEYDAIHHERMANPIGSAATNCGIGKGSASRSSCGCYRSGAAVLRGATIEDRTMAWQKDS